MGSKQAQRALHWLVVLAGVWPMAVVTEISVHPSRCITVGDRSFATDSPRLWNSLPADVRSASSLTAFCHTRIYFGNLTQTLFYNCVAIVVLEVMLI